MSNHLWDALMGPHANSDATLLVRPSGTRMTYRQTARLSAAMAQQLAAEAVGPGDRVLAMVEKSPEALALYLATLRVGAVFVPLNPAFTDAELAWFVADAQPKVIVCDPARQAAARALPGRILCMTLDAQGKGGLIAAASARIDPHKVVDRGSDDLAALIYTSGTTGQPKGAMLSHGNLLSNAAALADLWQIGAQDVLLHALPIFHIHGLFVAANTFLLKGAAMIWLPRYDTDEVLRLMPKASVMMGVPTFYSRLLAAEAFTRDSAAGIRLFTSGSAPLPARVWHAFAERTGQQILERYGLSETGMNTSNPYEGDRRPGTVGLPLPGVELRLTDPSGAAVAAGSAGMIEVRGPNVCRGYWNNPARTAEALSAEGWFRTGDLGRYDEAGYLVITGRARDMVISGGENIFPAEIETAIDQLPGVLESAVIGVPHPDLGEALVAVVARDEGADPKPDQILAGLSDLARYKQPRRILVIDSLPRNAMGKVKKAALRHELAEIFAA